MVDLGATHDLKGAEVTWESSRKVYKYKVEVSTDNVNWILAVDKTNNTNAAQTQRDSFTASARYVRVTMTGLESGAWASFWEFSVFGYPAPTPTPTQTPTPTNTLAPKTATAQAVANKNATTTAQVAQTRQGTAIAQTATSAARTATKAAINATATEVASYKEINWRELATYPEDHIGEKVIVRGVIFNVISKSEFQIWFTGTYESAYISMLDEYTGLYKDTSVVVYGMVAGKTCGKNAFGTEVCSPSIIGVFFGK